VNRPKSVLVASLMAILAAVPATAQQVPVQLQTIELCSGCFAYLEFPPLVESDTTSSLAGCREPTSARTTAEGRSPIEELAPTLVASGRQ
jgi:hypothetical protein